MELDPQTLTFVGGSLLWAAAIGYVLMLAYWDRQRADNE